MVEAAFRKLNLRNGAASDQPALDCFAPDGELVVQAPHFRATWDRRGIDTLASVLPENAVFGYSGVLRDGSALVGRFTVGGLGPDPELGRYVLRCVGDRVEQLELQIEPSLE
jgi:hypothetical protein